MRRNICSMHDVDIVFCIDATMSMYPVMDTVIDRILHFCQELYNGLTWRNRRINKFRVRIVAFKDYLADGDKAMMATDFFELPENAEQFEEALRSIDPAGGGDDLEDGLEALAVAMISDWCTGPCKKHHIIVVWSDDGTHELGYGKSAPDYPNFMPRDFNELSMWWGNGRQEGVMHQYAKRLLIIAPEEPWWTTIADNWDWTLHVTTDADCGLEDLDYTLLAEALISEV